MQSAIRGKQLKYRERRSARCKTRNLFIDVESKMFIMVSSSLDQIMFYLSVEMDMQNPCLCGQSWLLAGELESWPSLASPRSEVLLTVRTG